MKKEEEERIKREALIKSLGQSVPKIEEIKQVEQKAEVPAPAKKKKV